MTVHYLKTYPEYFKEIESGAKTFEVRRHDRDFQVGDGLVLAEWECEGDVGGYTGPILDRKITYVLEGGQFGIEKGYCVLGIRPFLVSEVLRRVPATTRIVGQRLRVTPT